MVHFYSKTHCRTFINILNYLYIINSPHAYTQTHTYTHKHTHTYTHTYTHTHTFYRIIINPFVYLRIQGVLLINYILQYQYIYDDSIVDYTLYICKVHMNYQQKTIDLTFL